MGYSLLDTVGFYLVGDLYSYGRKGTIDQVRYTLQALASEQHNTMCAKTIRVNLCHAHLPVHHDHLAPHRAVRQDGRAHHAGIRCIQLGHIAVKINRVDS